MSSSGVSLPQSPVLQQLQPNTTSSLSSFFSTSNNSNNFGIDCLTDSSKKRCRQRVDAGEPRNNYQGPLMNHTKSGIDSLQVNNQSENTDQDEDNESVCQQIDEENELILSGDNQQSDFELSDENEDQQQEGEETEINFNLPAPNLIPELPILVKHDLSENRHSNSSMSSSSSKRKRFQPQKQPLEDHTPETEKLDNKADADNKDTSDMPGLSSLQKELNSKVNQPGTLDGLVSSLNAKNMPFQSNVFANNMFMEMQRRMYASALQQQSQQNGRSEEETNTIVREAIMKDFVRFVQNLSEKFASAAQKMTSDFNLTETEKALFQHLKQKEKQPDWRNPQSFGMPNLNGMNPLFGNLNLPYSNPRNLIAMAVNQNGQQQNSAATSPFAPLINNSNVNNKMSSSGIFPTTVPNFPSFNGFVNNSATNNMSKQDDGSPRKKRSKVTDSVRGPRSAVRDNGNSLPASSRSSPQPNGYFPPTMVPHPLYNNTSFKTDRPSQSPGNSDEFSDYGVDGSFSQSSTLTHVHLRKAKLLFFYVRYPSSSVLKSYFPDINFNKSNTAQLVKWFSNFREFYYMQMEKFAKQAIAEGLTNASEIKVTPESEIYKQLNQHYNRNNFITPPETLSGVIEETLKEFFRALKEGRDAEPSWKKSIYKVIQQLDEQIPECFKSPTFMIQLESNQP